MPKLSFQYVRQDISETLLEFLVRRFKYHTLEEWENLVHAGHVRVNGGRTVPEHLLETRHRIVYDPPHRPEPPVDASYTVLYEDDALLAVSKSGNIPTSPSGRYWHNCLVHRLQEERGDRTLHAVHRLDRETSGINLFAKSKAAARTLGRDFQQGRVYKAYAAVVRGRFPAREIYLSAPLRDAVGGEVRIRQEVHPQGRRAATRFRLKALLPGASLLEAVPLTGRTHQIRAHAAHLGHPVWGDKLYGRSESDFIAWVSGGERNARERHLLHATALTVRHPDTGDTLALRDPERALLELFLDSLPRGGQTSGGPGSVLK
jgi:RluA family pseudouridine synthase